MTFIFGSRMLGIDRVDQLEDAKSVRFMSMRWTMGIGIFSIINEEMKLHTNFSVCNHTIYCTVPVVNNNILLESDPDKQLQYLFITKILFAQLPTCWTQPE